jgi:hypothetical protein
VEHVTREFEVNKNKNKNKRPSPDVPGSYIRLSSDGQACPAPEFQVE